MKIKTNDLIGATLDWAVAACEEKTAKGRDDIYWLPCLVAHAKYSTDWAQGGPIIARERIKVAPNMGGTWHGQIRHTKDHPLSRHPVLSGYTNQHGPTPLIAAMRCFVASKLGEEVDTPDELTQINS
jgi:hypothetical protein